MVAAMTTSTYRVTGMSCGHCVGAVESELGRLPGVAGVAVDLSAGEVTVTSQDHLDLDTIRAAVAEAGYELAS
jgi:copper chaperone